MHFPAMILAVMLASATQPAGDAGSISGRVFAKDADRLAPVVVYLEPVDASRTFPVSSAPVMISQRDARFAPPLLVIAAGQTVEFRNDEPRPIEHNVFSRSPSKPFDLGLYKPGAPDKRVTFDKPGLVRVYCSIHRYMDGAIYVVPTPFFAAAGSDGKFKIDNIPVGEYVVRTWQRTQRYPDIEQRVKIPSGGAQTMDLELRAE